MVDVLIVYESHVTRVYFTLNDIDYHICKSVGYNEIFSIKDSGNINSIPRKYWEVHSSYFNSLLNYRIKTNDTKLLEKLITNTDGVYFDIILDIIINEKKTYDKSSCKYLSN